MPPANLSSRHTILLLCPAFFDIILSNPVASLTSFPLLNPNWSFQSASSIFHSILLLSILSIFAVCAVVTAFCSFWFLLYGSHYNLSEILGDTVQVNICCWLAVSVFRDNLLPICGVHHHLTDSLSHFILQDARNFFVCT